MRIIFLIFSFIISLNAYECKNCENLGKVEKVYVANATTLYQLYAIDKSRVAGLLFEFWDIEKEYLDPEFVNLPVVGGFMGQGRTPNMEQVLALKPDLIIAGTKTTQTYRDIFDKTKIPTLYIDSTTLDESMNSFKVISEILDVKEKGDTLYDYALNSLNLAKEVSSRATKKPRIYYAYGDNGLSTDCQNSSVGNLVSLAGGELVHKCDKDRANLNFEQVLAYNPDKIIIYHKTFYDQIYKDKKWQLLDAVKNKEVYLIPRKPFSWVGKPASFMRFLGIRWLLEVLHPEVANLDLHQETKEFYRLFLYLDLDEKQIKDILNEEI
ncbi:MAG: ABC transporter substrate-binding protein [Campylobacteraceae bacterium]|nr:ABC transporter substrate-binding protein [Campylobacteraceae bacterium]